MRYSSAVNRAYYAIFHALRAVTALDGFDSGKHSGVIAYFNRNYVKNGIFNKRISKNIDMSFRLREKTDYQDLINREMAEEQINKAKEVLLEVKPYVVSIWGKEE
ncbi:MAG: HEPN domain-containing protein [Emergencia sp.]|nr:HEPN domain-containing protein [Emergencia sp.]